MSQLSHFNESDFDDQVIKSDVPVLVDFWAPWCGPCKAVAPILEELAAEYGEDVRIGKVDVDENPSIATQYGIQGIPTMLLFKDGEVVDRLVGARPKASIAEAIDSALGREPDPSQTTSKRSGGLLGRLFGAN